METAKLFELSGIFVDVNLSINCNVKHFIKKFNKN